MKIFLDTADVEEIERAAATGLIHGVTTNPTHVVKTGAVFEDVLKRICEIVPEHVSAEAVADTTDGLVREAERIAAIAPQIVIKVPMTRDGLMAIPLLGEKGIRTNVTMVFSPSQAFLAMSAGATFVSIVLSRLENVAVESEPLIRDTVLIKQNYGFSTEVLAASIKTQPTFLNCLRYGADIATIPASLFDQLYKHPLTDAGLEQFNLDWQKVTTDVSR